MKKEPLSSDIKDEDVVSDEYAVEYDISEIGNVLSELSNIQNTMNNLHKLDKDEDLP